MKKYSLLILVLLVIHVLFLINFRFTAWPEMLSYPYLRNNGFLLYLDMIHPDPPVLTMALSIVFKVFGYKLIVLKIFTWLIILANDVLIFLIAKKITKKSVFAFLSLFLYVFTQPFLEGNQLWFDLAIVPFILLGTLFLLNKKYFLSGLALGIAILTKQTTGLFLIFWGIYILLTEKKIKPVLKLIFGPLILFVILLVRLVTEGAVLGFFNWVLIYPFMYWSKFPGYVQMILSKRESLIIGLLSLPFILLIIKFKKKIFKELVMKLLLMNLIISLIIIYPRFSFFHFQLALAFISVIFAYFVYKFKKSKYLSFFLITYFISIFFFVINPKLSDWNKDARFWGEEEKRFVETIVDNSSQNDSIYLMGPHSGLYVLSQRLPVKPWSDNYIWYLEIPSIQEEIIERWEDDKPKVIFTTEPMQGNWFDLGTYRPEKIVNWIEENDIKKVDLTQ